MKKSEISRNWYVLDASETSAGRLAVKVAGLLMGKGKPSYTPHMDNGDHVVIINADKAVFTGNKAEKKVYYRHSGYPGGIYKRTLAESMEKDSAKVIAHAVRGMLPVNKLRDGRLKRLHIYGGPAHSHAGQNPTVVSLKKGKA
ncbi:MAG TPA: 50S ribosomal protein L13 [Candidatus Saccharimonadales bacterium]|nr:50S ribosomal protein L13 [Candidatus Saccharimonadales bacterium]